MGLEWYDAVAMAIAVVVSAIAVRWWERRVGVHDAIAGDSIEYRMGATAPRPFCWRWGPRLLFSSPWQWLKGTQVMLALSGGIVYLFGRVVWEAEPFAAAALTWMWVWLPGVWERTTRVVYLTEGMVIPAGLLAAVAWKLGGWWWIGAVPLTLLVGTFREVAGVWVALWGMTPWGLVGLLAVPWWRRGGAPQRHAHLFVHPWKTFAKARWRAGLGVRPHLTAWGVAAPGLLTANPWVLGAMVMAAWPLLRSIDTVRLLIWAWPAVAGGLVAQAPVELLIALVVLAPVGALIWDA